MIKAIGQLGGTGLQLARVDVSGLPERAFIPLGEIKEARREAVEALLSARVEQASALVGQGVSDEPVLPQVMAALRGGNEEEAVAAAEWSRGGGDKSSRRVQRKEEWVRRGVEDAQVTILCRTQAQAVAATQVLLEARSLSLPLSLSRARACDLSRLYVLN